MSEHEPESGSESWHETRRKFLARFPTIEGQLDTAGEANPRSAGVYRMEDVESAARNLAKARPEDADRLARDFTVIATVVFAGVKVDADTYAFRDDEVVAAVVDVLGAQLDGADELLTRSPAIMEGFRESARAMRYEATASAREAMQKYGAVLAGAVTAAGGLSQAMKVGAAGAGVLTALLSTLLPPAPPTVDVLRDQMARDAATAPMHQPQLAQTRPGVLQATTGPAGATSYVAQAPPSHAETLDAIAGSDRPAAEPVPADATPSLASPVLLDLVNPVETVNNWLDNPDLFQDLQKSLPPLLADGDLTVKDLLDPLRDMQGWLDDAGNLRALVDSVLEKLPKMNLDETPNVYWPLLTSQCQDASCLGCAVALYKQEQSPRVATTVDIGGMYGPGMAAELEETRKKRELNPEARNSIETLLAADPEYSPKCRNVIRSPQEKSKILTAALLLGQDEDAKNSLAFATALEGFPISGLLNATLLNRGGAHTIAHAPGLSRVPDVIAEVRFRNEPPVVAMQTSWNTNRFSLEAREIAVEGAWLGNPGLSALEILCPAQGDRLTHSGRGVAGYDTANLARQLLHARDNEVVVPSLLLDWIAEDLYDPQLAAELVEHTNISGHARAAADRCKRDPEDIGDYARASRFIGAGRMTPQEWDDAFADAWLLTEPGRGENRQFPSGAVERLLLGLSPADREAHPQRYGAYRSGPGPKDYAAAKARPAQEEISAHFSSPGSPTHLRSDALPATRTAAILEIAKQFRTINSRRKAPSQPPTFETALATVLSHNAKRGPKSIKDLARHMQRVVKRKPGTANAIAAQQALTSFEADARRWPTSTAATRQGVSAVQEHAPTLGAYLYLSDREQLARLPHAARQIVHDKAAGRTPGTPVREPSRELPAARRDSRAARTDEKEQAQPTPQTPRPMRIRGQGSGMRTAVGEAARLPDPQPPSGRAIKTVTARAAESGKGWSMTPVPE